MTPRSPRLSLTAYLLWVCLGAVGCGPVMAIVPRNGESALATTQANVHLAVYGAEWPGVPRDLPARVHAIYVDVQNASANTIRVSYQDFSLSDGFGFVAHPLVPGTFSMNDVERDGNDAWLAARGRHSFGSSRSHHRSFSHHHPISKRRSFWSRRRFRFGRVSSFSRGGSGYFRPRRDTRSLAMYEGVLPPGAHVAGFVYFSHAPGYTEGALDLAWDVVKLTPPDPSTPTAPPSLETLGRLSLPLESLRVR